ncbi:unnamed protein product [Parnassius apollo]|uniref:(apollo) hypothetical protein n=1 Tax=Parnassius apollo TaxID=110799 RepID=A0A8S3X0I8_PARAO|nr:unnamed protein product [Parnassius apollo]
MLLGFLLTVTLLSSVNSNEESNKVTKPYVVFPVPFDLPNRNDRATQCWLRIEDVEVVETVAVYCTIALTFIRYHIHEYNSRKMTEDGVDVSLWREEPLSPKDFVLTAPEVGESNGKDWKVSTVLDPITRMRIYVTQKADCKLIIYSREGVSNYKVDCDRILYYVNSQMSSATSSRGQVNLLVFMLTSVLFVVK